MKAMDEDGKYEKASSSNVPGFCSRESKDSTQVVYIYTTSAEIKHEPADQHSFDDCREKDESYGDNVYCKEESRANRPQRYEDPEPKRVYGHDDIDEQRHSFRSGRFYNYTKSWGQAVRVNNKDNLENVREERSPNEAKKCLSDRRKQILRGNESREDNNGNHRLLSMREEERVSYSDRYYPSGYQREKRRRDSQQFEENERANWYKTESKQNSFEDTGRAGRKSFTPLRIYPKELCRDRSYLQKRHEYRYGDAPPNVTLMGQGYRAAYELRDGEVRYCEDDMSSRELGNEKDEGKLRSHKRVKCGTLQEGMSIAPQRHESEDCRGHMVEGKQFDDNYEMFREGKGGEIYRWEKEVSRCKSLEKMQNNCSPEWKEGRHSREEAERRNTPDDYIKLGQNESYSRFSCEIGGNREPVFRYFECFGGHEYDYPRKCDRYSELIHDNESQQNRVKGLERRGMGATSPEVEEKQIATQKGYVMAAYQRCCCPCCPCYSFFRQRQRDRSPISPRNAPQKPSVSPAPVGRPPSHTVNEPAKSRPSTMTQQVPPDLQLKMVTRGLPHLRRRRNRTVYTHDQIEELEEVFKIKHYLDVDEKGSIAKRLGIRTENVEIWFKNRRAKWRKEMKSVKSNSDDETSQYLDEDESNNGDENERYERKSLKSIFSKDIPEERPTMTLYHTGQEPCDNEVDSTVVVAAAT